MYHHSIYPILKKDHNHLLYAHELNLLSSCGILLAPLAEYVILLICLGLVQCFLFNFQDIKTPQVFSSAPPASKMWENG